MHDRVSCNQCGAHRDRALDSPGLTPVCFVCRGDGRDCTPIPLNTADLHQALAVADAEAARLRAALATTARPSAHA